jgi:Protein of unknown function (DUF1566)
LRGANDWRLPTLDELQTIVLDFPCTNSSCSCGSNPCIDGTFGPTQSSDYWSATSYVPNPNNAWNVNFNNENVNNNIKTNNNYVRTVRGGW